MYALKYSSKQWLDLISNGEVQRAITEALKFVRQENLELYEEELVVISSQWFTVQKELSKGIISYDNFTLQTNKIRTNLVRIIMELKK